MNSDDPSDDDPFAGTLLYRYLLLAAVAAVVLVPLGATALGGFKSLGELRAHPFGLPQEWRWQQYADILAGPRYWRMIGNSLLIASLTTFLTLALAAMAAFVFAHLRFFGERYVLAYLQLGLLFPAAAAVLPLFIQVRDLGLLDSYFGVVLPATAFSLGLSLLLLRNFFRRLPSELLDAALVDGCSYLQYFVKVTLPLSRPILATVGTIAFVQSWNNYLLPLILLDSESKYPWPLGLMVYQGEYSTDWHLLLAFVTLTLLPTVALFLAAQRWIVAGLTAGAVKG